MKLTKGTIAGTVTANAGTNLNTSALALESGGNLAAAATSLAAIDDWDESDRAKVNPIVGQAGVQGGSGTVSSNTQRVVLATDVALPAGTNTIGSIASITTSIVPGTGATNLGKAEDAAHASGDTGVMMLGVRNDSAASLTSTNGDYSPIATNSYGALFLASVVPGTTSTELGKAEDAAHSSGSVGIMHLGVRNDNLATSFSGADADYTPIAVTARGGAYKGVYRAVTTLTAINTTYNNTTTTATSASVDCQDAVEGILMFQLTESGAATDITIELQVSDDNSTFFTYREAPWTKYRFDDATIAAYTTLSEAVKFPIIARYIRFVVTATGTDASNTFTIANARVQISSK